MQCHAFNMLCFVHANIFRVVPPVNPENRVEFRKVKQFSSVAGVLPKVEEVSLLFSQKIRVSFYRSFLMKPFAHRSLFFIFRKCCSWLSRLLDVVEQIQAYFWNPRFVTVGRLCCFFLQFFISGKWTFDGLFLLKRLPIAALTEAFFCFQEALQRGTDRYVRTSMDGQANSSNETRTQNVDYLRF